MGFQIGLQQKTTGLKSKYPSHNRSFVIESIAEEFKKPEIEECLSNSGIASTQEANDKQSLEDNEEDMNLLHSSSSSSSSSSHEGSFQRENYPKISIEKQVIDEYQHEIDKLEVPSTLKSYLKRTLDTIVHSKESDKVFLLQIRKQLKASSRSSQKQSYSEFLKLVDKLYFLAVDKQISFGNTPNTISENPHRISDSLLRLQDSISGSTGSLEIIRRLQRNALQRLAAALRTREQERLGNTRYSQEEEEQNEELPELITPPSMNLLRDTQARNHFFGVRSAFSQVAASQGDTSIHTSSDTGSNSSVN